MIFHVFPSRVVCLTPLSFQFDTFLLRFGPLELSFTKAMDALFDGAGNLQPWFHGNCCDAEATRAGAIRVHVLTSMWNT
jgi:hypothetical protein